MIIVHDRRLPFKYKKALAEKFQAAVFHPFSGLGRVYDSISCHPDIYFFQLDEKTLIHAPGLPEEELYPLKKAGVDLIKGEDDPCGTYPDTARYNAVRVGGAVFHNLKYTDPVILDIARERGLKLVDVAQGYTRCSVLVLNENALVTADKGISEAARMEGMDVLTVSPAAVSLPGEDHGFIGGAGGKMPDNTTLVLGEINYHPEAMEVKNFLAKHQVQYVDLKKLPIYDAGGSFIF